MRRLMLRARPDLIVNQVRRQGVAVARAVYLTILGLVGLWLVNLLFGSYFYLKSDGVVLAPSTTLATEYTATLRSVDAREGERVTAGQRVATITSQLVAESIARLTADVASLTTRVADLRIRSRRNEALDQLTTDRSLIATETRQRFETLQRRGLLTADKRTDAIDAEYHSRVDAEVLKAEQEATLQQLAQLEPVMDKVTLALASLAATYGTGDIVTPMSGIVGRRYVEPGTVIKSGEPIFDIYGGAPYVVTYLSTGAQYTIEPGQEVIVEWGLKRTRGRVAGLEQVAVAMPKEFQTAFKPAARNQLLRIALVEDGAELPPLFSKVRVRGSGWLAWLFGWLA
jgi:multidrug resistance efflux pump